MAPQRHYRWLFVSLVAFGLVADLASKYVVFEWLYNKQTPASRGAFESWTACKTWRTGQPSYIVGGRYNLVPGWFGFSAEYDPGAKPDDGFVGKLQTVSAPILPHVNRGALFGLGSDPKDFEGSKRANLIFAGVSVIAIIAIGGWAGRKKNTTDKWLCIALGLILGGTIGNCYDRLVFGGVRDFLYFYNFPYTDWPVFNIADCGLVVGACILVVQAAFGTAKPAEKSGEMPQNGLGMQNVNVMKVM